MSRTMKAYAILAAQAIDRVCVFLHASEPEYGSHKNLDYYFKRQ